MAPNLTLTLWDPRFLCLSWRGRGSLLSPTPAADGPPHAGCSAAYAHGHPTSVFVCVGTRVSVHRGVRGWGAGSLAVLLGLRVP